MKNTALNFTYGNQSSMSFGIIKINFSDSILTEEVILPERTITSDIRKHTSVIDIYSIDYDTPLTFEMDLLLDDKWKEENFLYQNYLRNVVRWLQRNTFLPLTFDTMPDTVFYAIMASDFKIYHNNRNQGYLKVTVTCNAPFGFTKVQNSPIYNNIGTNVIELIANSDFDTTLVKVLVKKIGDGDLLIKSLTNQSEYNLIDLKDGDQIILDSFHHMMTSTDINNNEIIINDKKINHSWLTLLAEVNRIELNGDAEIQFLWQGSRVL